jgi:uncharacterized protein involved in exopolysaccharide biosynthesis
MQENGSNISTEIDLFGILLVAAKKWRLILIAALIAGLAAIVYKSSFAKTNYQAEAILYTQSEAADYLDLKLKDQPAAHNNIVVDTCNIVLLSNDFLNKIATKKYSFTNRNGKPFKGTLFEFLETKDINVVAKYLKQHISIDFNKRSRLLTLKALTFSPQLSMQLANNFTHQTDTWYRSQINAAAEFNMKFVGKRLTEVNKMLTKSKEELLAFLRKNRGCKMNIENAENLSSEAQLYAFELNKYLDKVKLQSDISRELSRKYELLKIEAQKESSSIVVVKRAELPEHPVGKGRLKAGIGGAAGGAFIVIVLLLANAMLGEDRRKLLLQTLKK